MGPLFQVVVYDVKNKIAVLKRLQESENSEHYVSVRSMVEYEVSEGLTLPDCPAHLSGVKKLLHLHRALEFVKQFMEELVKLDDVEEVSLAQRTSEIYLSTCGRFHPKLLTKTFCGLLFLMPDRSDIREKLTKDNSEVEEKLIQEMPGVVEVVQQTYDATQIIYAAHEVLDID